MKALKSTGLVPVEFLRPNGPYQKGQIAGLDPAMVKKLKASKTTIIKEVSAGAGVETIDIDDDSLVEIVPDSPSLGGYDHTPPLGSDKVPGRNRFVEEPASRGTALPESASSPKSRESLTAGRFPGEDLIDGGDDAGVTGAEKVSEAAVSTGAASKAEDTTAAQAASTGANAGKSTDDAPAAPSTAKSGAATAGGSKPAATK